MPRWLGRLNRRAFNSRALARGTWPVLRHVGRVSGRTFRTPVGAVPVEGGYVINIVYGRRTDWLRNVLAAGECVLEVDGQERACVRPRIVALADVGRVGPVERSLRITEGLRLDVVGGAASPG